MPDTLPNTKLKLVPTHARHEHDRYLNLPIPGSTDRNHDTTIQYNITNIPPSLSARESYAQGNLYRSKLDRAMNVINQQRSQLTKLSWRCHHLEAHITKHGIRKDFEEELKNLDEKLMPIIVRGIEDDTRASVDSASNYDATLSMQLEKARNEIEKLHNRVDTLTSTLKKLAPSPRDVLSKWHSGPVQLTRRHASVKPKYLTERSEQEVSRVNQLFIGQICDLIALLNDKADLVAFSERLIHQVATILKATEAVILLIDNENGNLYAHVVSNKDIPCKKRIPIGKGIVGTSVVSNAPVNLINCTGPSKFARTPCIKILNAGSRSKEYAKFFDGKHKSMICVPFRRVGNKAGALGVLKVADKQDANSFDGDDLSIAKICATMFAQRYSSYLLAQEVERERLKSQTLFGTAESLMAINDVDGILESVVHKLTMFIDASFSVLFWVDNAKKELAEIVCTSRPNMLIRVPASYKSDPSNKVEKNRLPFTTPALVCKVVASGKLVFISNAQTDRRFNRTFDDYVGEPKRIGVTRSLVAVPVTYKSSERMVGVIVLGKVENSFSSTDIEQIGDFNDLICISLARLMAMHRKSKALNDEISCIKNLVDSMGNSKDDTPIADERTSALMNSL